MQRPKYIEWITEENSVVLEDGTPLACYSLDYKLDDHVFDDWALHLRKHYVRDGELDESLSVNGLTVEQYLREYVIPQKNDVFGPSSRSNDITEILVSDLLEFVFSYKVPRCKQQNRSGKTQSEHGTDIIAYKFHNIDKTPSKNDELIAAEVKAKLTSTDAGAIIDAATDSKKDEHRFAHTLDYYRKKLKSLGNASEANDVARFQQKTENNYNITLIGAAVSSQADIPDKIIMGITGEQLCLKSNQKIFYIHGKKLMDLAHIVYDRCVK